MNPINFDWLDQLPTVNEANESEDIFQTLGLETSRLTSTENSDEQDIVKYLFDTVQFATVAASHSTAAAETHSQQGPPSESMSSSSSYISGSSPSLDMETLNPPVNSDNGSSNNNSDKTRDGINNNLVTTEPAFQSNWLTSFDGTHAQTTFSVINSRPASKSDTSSSTTTSASRKMRLKKKREPIFVTESPQNAYKKKNKKSQAQPSTSLSSSSTSSATVTSPKNGPVDERDQQPNDSSSPSSHFEDDEDMEMNDVLDKRHMSSKEKRQLRNKISARNFRVRRKEYINQLESKVDEQEDEIEQLKKDNKRMADLNQQLVQEVMQLRLQVQQQAQPQQSAPLPLSTVNSTQMQPLSVQPIQHMQSLVVTPPSSDSSNSPPDFMESLLDFGLFNNNSISNNTYLSHTLMPDFDLSNVLGGKLARPPSSAELEDSRELMTMYPLLAPALASIVIRHTFSLHYVAYLAKTFPYSSRSKDDVLDILNLEDWVTAVSSTNSQLEHGDNGSTNDGSCSLVPAHIVETKLNGSGADASSKKEDDWSADFERLILQHHYPYYTFMRLRGFSHEEIIRRCRLCCERKMTLERQRRRKAAESCNKLQVFQAFTAVASTLFRHPSKAPLIASVIQDTKVCQVGSKSGRSKVSLLVTAPFRRATLMIGGGK